MYMKTKELGGKENSGIQNIGIEHSEGNTIADQRQVMNLWEKCFTELYDRSNGLEHLKVEPKRKQMQTREVLVLYTVKWRDEKATRGDVHVTGLRLMTTDQKDII